MSLSKVKRERVEPAVPATTGGRKRAKSDAGSEPSIPPALSGGNGWLMARTPREMDGESSFGGSTSTPARTNTTARGSLRKKEKETKHQKGAAMPCPICLKYPQDLPAGEWSSTGCKVHVSVVKFGYPSQTMEACAAQYHDRSDGGKFKMEFDMAAKIMSRLLNSDSFPALLPASDVGFSQVNYVESFYEVCFATEADMVRLFGYGGKALKMKPVSMRLEDGSGRVSGYYLSMVNMDQTMKDSLRRVRIGCKMAVEQHDNVMTPATQVRHGQAEEVMAICTEKHLQTRNPAERCAGRAHMVTLEGVLKKVHELKEASSGQGDVSIEDEEEEDSENGSEAEEEEEDEVSLVPDFSFGRLATEAMPKRAAAKKKAKEETDLEETMAEADLLAEIQDDLELKQVHKVLDKNYMCLAGLVLSKILGGNLKVGHQLRGAKQLVKKLQAMRSPLASLLEKRVDLVERLQILQLKKVRGIPRPELVQHLTCMDEAKVALPLRVRLDVFECQVADSLGDILCGSGQESVVDVVKRFYYWTPPQGELKESRQTMAHILAAEDEAHQRMLLSGEITKDKEAELKKHISEVSCEVIMDTFGCQAVMQAMNEPSKFRGKLLELMTHFANLSEDYVQHFQDEAREDDLPVLLGMVARSVCILLTPYPQFGAPADVSALGEYKNGSVVIGTFKQILSQHTFWLNRCNELVSKGAATTTFQPKMEKYEEALESGLELDAVYIKEIVDTFPEMKNKMRPGCTDQLEKLLTVFLQKQTCQILNNVDTTTSVSMLEAICNGLTTFQQVKGFLQLSSKLQSYKEANLNKLACEEIRLICNKYPEPRADLPVPDTPESRKQILDRISDMLAQVAPHDDLLQDLKSVGYWIFRGLALQFEAASGMVDKEMVTIFRFKDFLRAVQGANKSGVWDQNALAWMQSSLEVCIAVADLKKSSDRDFDTLAKSAKAMHSAVCKQADLEGDWRTQTLGGEPDPLEALINFSWCCKAKDMLEEPGFLDKIELHIAESKQNASQILRKMGAVTKNLMEDEQSWKGELDEGASLQDVLDLAAAEGSLNSLDGEQVDACLGDLKKVLDGLRKTCVQLKAMGRPADDSMQSLVLALDSSFIKVKVLKAEGILACALAQTSSAACTRATLRWAQELLRKELVDLPEEMIYPVLLAEGKAVLARSPQGS